MGHDKHTVTRVLEHEIVSMDRNGGTSGNHSRAEDTGNMVGTATRPITSLVKKAREAMKKVVKNGMK